MTDPTPTLALVTLATESAANATAWWMFVGQMTFNAIVTLGMFWLKRKTEETEALRARVEKRDAEIKAGTERLVNERMGVMLQAIERIEKRLEAGDQRFKDLNTHDHQAEIKLVQSFEQLRRYVVEYCAKASDQKEMGDKIEALRIEVTRLKEAA